jgi:hypothetical protein
MALPIYSVPDMETAKSLTVRLCRLGYDGVYRLTDFSGEYEDIDKASAQFQKAHEHMKARGKP